MKHKNDVAVGSRAKILCEDDALEILKVMSSNTWIYKIPSILTELINDNHSIAIEAVRYVPNIYFDLNNKMQNNRKLIKETINSFYKHNRIWEINIGNKPLTKRRKNQYRKFETKASKKDVY